MMNLFSIFDPASYFKINLNFLSSLVFIFLTSFSYWTLNSNKTLFKFNILKTLSEEMKMLMSSMNFGKSLFFVSLILFIVINNFLGLYPYIFTYSSHLVMTLSLSLPIWLSSIMFGWNNKTLIMLSHLIPPSTSAILMPFMVCVESISILIRPFTLAIRLSTNMIAGHLLMTLLSNQAYFNFFSIKLMVITVQLLLIMLEIGVSFIQAYVFSILSLLYAIESN